MSTTESQELLRAFVERQSEAAFQELVHRYVDLVYSAALRRVNGASLLAQDVVQLVFTDLARKAATLPPGVALGGWLHRHTGFVASAMMRSEHRRQHREEEAIQMNALNQPSESDWTQLAPVLDSAMDELDPADRDAIVLRFFENRSFRDIGAGLGTSDDAAQKRVCRALEKLRGFLVQRGIGLSVGALGVALGTRAVAAAPPGLAVRVSKSALAAATAGSAGLVAALYKLLALSGLKWGLAGAIVVLTSVFLSLHSAPVRPGSAWPRHPPPVAASAPDLAGPGIQASGIESGASVPADAPLSSNVLHLAIVAADSGKPVPNVPIECRAWMGQIVKRETLRADRFGVCEVEIPRATITHLELTTRMDGFADTRLHWERDRGEVVPKAYTLRLVRPAPIGGVVLDPDGQPVPGAKVGFNHQDSPATASAPEDHQFGFIQVSTDTNGHWNIERIAPEMVRSISARLSCVLSRAISRALAIQRPSEAAGSSRIRHIRAFGHPGDSGVFSFSKAGKSATDWLGEYAMTDGSSLQPGQKAGSGRFTLVKPLGRGGMGEVWLAQDGRLSESVALKFLPPEVRADPAALDDLRRETARSHRLTHPNIVRIHDFHEPEGEAAFVSMEYVQGLTLSAVRVQQPTRVLSWELLRPLVEQLCAALAYAHGEHIVHRDLKPSNLLLESRGRLKLADFGIAAVVSDSMSRVSLKGTSGTLAYMSPQQLAGRRPSPADDLYALGATLYELLTGKPPFFTGDLTHQILHELPEPLAERCVATGIPCDVPPDIAALIMACLAKEPSQRPPSAEAVAAWLVLPAVPVAMREEGGEPASCVPPPPAPPPTPAVRIQEPEPSERATEAFVDSGGEEMLWAGKPAFFSFVPGLAWSLAWCCLWLYLATSSERLIPSPPPSWPKDQQDLMRMLKSFAPTCSWFFCAFTLMAGWGCLQRLLRYFGSEFQITTQRIKTRVGSFPQKLIQFDLRDIRGIEARQTFLGRVLNYADIELAVENRPSTETLLHGVPDGEAVMEIIRVASRQAAARASRRETEAAKGQAPADIGTPR